MMTRLVFALLLCGMGLVSYAQPMEMSSRLVVLKGTATDTVHYVLYDPVPDTEAAADQRTALGVGAIGLSTKPKTYYYLVVYMEYTPQFSTTGKWAGEGDLWTWTMGAVEYGIGRHDVNGVWRATAPLGAFARDIGWAVDFGGYYWWQPKLSKKRVGDGSILSTDNEDPALRTYTDWRDGVAELTYTAVLKKSGAESWYEPNISSLTISYTQWMQQKFTGDVWRDTQFGVGKVLFKPDVKLTTKANLTDAVTGENTGLALVAADIQALLLKGKYTTDVTFMPNLDPSGWFDESP